MTFLDKLAEHHLNLRAKWNSQLEEEQKSKVKKKILRKTIYDY